MKQTDYNKFYKKIFETLGELTPLNVDCGKLCDCACCKGDENIGMELFPFEETTLSLKITEDGRRLAICNGNCDRASRPLACRIFPFFPTVDERGRVFIEKDIRAVRLCPLLIHSDEIIFNHKFFKALKKVGKILVKDEECFNFLKTKTEEIDFLKKFY